jgi:hypothetical protein
LAFKKLFYLMEKLQLRLMLLELKTGINTYCKSFLFYFSLDTF